MNDLLFTPTFTIRRSKELETLTKEELVELLPKPMQDEVAKVEWSFKNIDRLLGKDIVDPVDGSLVRDHVLSREDILLLFDPEPEYRDDLTQEENYLVYIASDPVLWTRVYLKLNPKIPQILVLRQSRNRVILRWGRRLGKSTTLAIRMLWRSLTKANNKSILVAPMLSHIRVTWDMLIELLQRDEELKELYLTKKIKNREQPHHELKFPNGSVIKGFTSGMRSKNNADSVRGQEADDLYCDEIDYMNAGDLKALQAIVRKTPGHEQKYWYVSSTPSGRRDMMYRFSSEFARKKPKLYKEYYFPTHCDLLYTKEEDSEFRMTYTHNNYLHEFGADYGEEASGVFLQAHIERAQSHYPVGYKYERNGYLTKEKGTKRVVGVDWDKFGAGVNIVISDFRLWQNIDEDDPDAGRVKILARFEVPRGEFTLTEGRELVKKIYLTYNPDLIVIDRGYGESQSEDLLLAGKTDRMYSGLDKILKPFAMNENITIIDPITRLPVNKEAKDYMVDQTINLLESDQVILNKIDSSQVPGLTNIITQFESYVVVGMSIYGKPRYEPGNQEIGDHALDAFMLTILGAVTEWGDFSRARKLAHPVAVNFDPRRSTGKLLDMSSGAGIDDLNLVDAKYIRRSTWKNRGRVDNSRKRTYKRSMF